MAITFRDAGDEDSSFPLAPPFPAGIASQDISLLNIVTLGTHHNGTWQRPLTPAGWTLLVHPQGDQLDTLHSKPANLTYYLYYKVGTDSGTEPITFNGVGSMPAFAISGIDTFTCGASEVWDVTTFSYGYDKSHNWWYEAQASRLGVNGNGRIDPGPGDMIYVVSLFNTANSGYPTAGILPHTTHNVGIYRAGKNIEGGPYVNVDTAWVGATGNLNEGMTLVRSYFPVSTVKPPHGSPKLSMPLYNPGPGVTVNVRLTLRDKSSSDARTVTDTTKVFGLSSADTGGGTEGSRDNGPLNANRDFEEIEGVSNWTASNGATIEDSFLASKVGFQSMRINPNGVTASPRVVSEELTIIKNSYYYVHAWMRGNSETLNLGIQWFNSSHSLISTSSVNKLSVAGEWDEYEMWAQAVPGAEYARIVIDATGTPTTAEFWYVDEVYIADGSVRNKTAVPYPHRWKNGEVPTAALLNNDWRDTFRWLLGYSKPIFSGYSTNTSNWSVSTWHPLPINVEVLKRGGFVHSANDTKIYVPEDGWYEFFVYTSRDSTAAGTTAKDWTGIRRNGTGGWIIGAHEPHITDLDKVNTPDPGSVYLSAGDYIELAVFSFASAGTVKNWSNADTHPRIDVWWGER